MRHTIILNWKNYLATGDDAVSLLHAIKSIPKNYTLTVCPSFLHLESVGLAIGRRKILLGAQDIYDTPTGAQTGIIAATELQKIGVKQVIVGHLETRKRGVTDEEVVNKTLIALEHKIKPIICLSRPGGTGSLTEVREQSTHLFEELKRKGFQESAFQNISIAYEPSAAVGGDTAVSVESIQATALHLRDIVRRIFSDTALKHVRILYGGSVDDCNAHEILISGKVDGFLVGRAGSTPEALKKFLRAL